MAASKRRARRGWTLGFTVLAVGSSAVFDSQAGWASLWPSAVALVLVFVSRSAFCGLLVGALCGSILIADSAAGLGPVLVDEQFLPIFRSPWKLSAMAFTLLLGGFVALLEAGGGLQAMLRGLLGSGRRQAKRMQGTVMGFGLFVFFDGLANTMLIGRVLRSAADRAGVSRVKLAYLADTTGSAVACLAFISTWIAFQLSMIRQGYAAVGREVNAYALFFQSVPVNFYGWFALALALVCVLREFNPGPMGAAEAEARRRERPEAAAGGNEDAGGHWAFAVVPVLVLAFSIPALAYVIGAESVRPFSLGKFARAYGAAESHVPQILVLSSLLAALVAAIPVVRARGGPPAFRIFLGGVRDLLGPIGILLAAWMLGSAIGELGAADRITGILTGRLAPEWLPVTIFLTGAFISFATGTSWGTMGVLMPLAIPVVLSLGGVPGGPDGQSLAAAAVAAVFSGAVFGDHCSPFSDTTIVSSIAAGVEPLDHVRTQLPFAGIAAAVAALAGFLPLGYGVPGWAGMLAGVGVLVALPSVWRLGRRAEGGGRRAGS